MVLAKNEAGFTLIELIASLVIIGFLAMIMGFGIITGVQGYLIARDKEVAAEKGQAALGRITRELREMRQVLGTVSGASPFIIYDNITGEHSLSLVGDTVKIRNGRSVPDYHHGDVLVDHVSHFSLTCRKLDGSSWSLIDPLEKLAIISVQLTVALPGTRESLDFSTDIVPRNTGLYNGPHG